jgi:hypothetical protein
MQRIVETDRMNPHPENSQAQHAIALIRPRRRPDMTNSTAPLPLVPASQPTCAEKQGGVITAPPLGHAGESADCHILS